jgi:hypothetical protein
MVRLAYVVAGLLACTSSAGPTEEAGRVEPKSVAAADAMPAECAAKVAAMRALFALGPGEVLVVNPAGVGRFPASSRGVVMMDGFPAYLRGDGGFELDHKPHTAEEVKAALVEEYEQADQLMANTGRPPAVRRLLLAADARAPVARLLELTALAPSGTEFALVVELAGDVVPTPPPMPPAVRAVVHEARADERSFKLAELIEPAVRTCVPVHKVFEAVSTTTSDMRSKVLLDGLPGALEECRCAGVDVDTLFSAVWAMTGKTEVAMRMLGLPLSADPKAEAVELPAAATVEDLVKVLESRDGRPFRVVQA